MKQLGFIVVFILCVGVTSRAQTTFATLKLSRTAVYPGEPFRLTVKTFSSTYFLSPITFQDFHVANAFTISFSRTLSGITKVDGKQYATLEFFLQVYPVESGVLEIPPVKLSFQSPPEGDYKGKLQQIETNPARITIKAIPENSTVNPWFVTNRLLLSDSWGATGKTYKVGDVIERQVLVKAFGTMPNFIPELNFDESDGFEVYPKASVLQDKRNDEEAIGWKTQKILYLLTLEGEVTIPEVEVNWFNPLTSKPNTSKLNAKTIQVLPNPDLGILETVKDSLNIMDSEIDSGMDGAEKTDFRKIGIVSLLVLAALFLLWKVFNFVKRILERLSENRKQYRKSSAWHFKQISKNGLSPLQRLNAINKWWDLARKGDQPASISDLLKGTPAVETWLGYQRMKDTPDRQELKRFLEELGNRANISENRSDQFAINPGTSIKRH